MSLQIINDSQTKCKKIILQRPRKHLWKLHVTFIIHLNLNEWLRVLDKKK